ncbi:Tm-1-like ATP-binding domain-containing protein [Dyadobacter sediminis]|uniref:UPF0261 family protein n=1 Tax=Dyadobacter sediminis TaxID=1493691 RepID=A0A5R9KI28_9BACT|nr:Tm-1-like ATP-binding domain-containing protein [Dyadobacter sediminis]TLU95824.1 UPF0261 family protein [Dyadobacter sediminis]GGB76870.1 hypothetical protein GCM10011325_00450 [Dyadobacter sediminis]
MSSSTKSILIIGCFDTKAAVFAYLYGCIVARGEKVLTINTGVMGSTGLFPVDFECDAVALEGGESIMELRNKRDRGYAMDVMGKGAARIVSGLVAQKRVKGAIGMGGGGGTYIALASMQEIPFGIPKICLSTIASKDLARQIGHKDITLIPSVVDVAGLNSVIQVLVGQAAEAICAMSNVVVSEKVVSAGTIAVSMFGNTTACVDKCTELLQMHGYEVLAFHANGVGGKAMEALIREGVFSAVLDITTTELADELCDGICSAGPQRLEAATETGLPQVVVPGCLDMVNFAHRDTVPKKFMGRHLYSWAPDVTLMRTNEEENRILGKTLAQKLNRSSAPVTVVLPLKGLSQIGSEDGIFYNPGADRILFDSIKDNLNEKAEIVEVDANINDTVFAMELVARLLASMPVKLTSQQKIYKS